MSRRTRALDTGLLFAAFAVPFLLVLAADVFVVGRRYFDVLADEALHFWVGHGIAWNALVWPPFGQLMPHVPGVAFYELAGLYVRLFGVPVEDLSGPSAFLILLHVVTILGAAAWGTSLARLLEIPPLPIFAAAALAALQPSMMFIWTVSYSIVVLMLPVGLGLLAIAERVHAQRRRVTATYLMLGFLLSEHYLTAFLDVALVAAMAAAALRRDTRPILQAVSADKPTTSYQGLVICLALLFLVGPVLGASRIVAKTVQPIVGDFGEFGRVALFSLLALGAAGGFAILLAIRPVRQLVFAVGGRLLVGWAIGTNVMMFLWAPHAVASFRTGTGQTKVPVTLAEALGRGEPTRFFTFGWWRLAVPLLLCIGIAALVRAHLPKAANKGRDFWVGMFLAVLVAMLILLTSQGYWMRFTAETDTVGRGRVYVPIIAALLLGLGWLYRLGPRQGLVGASIALVLAGLSYVHYLRNDALIAQRARAIDAATGPIVAQHLASDPNAKVLCVGSFVPEACSTAYGYWWARMLLFESPLPVRPIPIILRSRVRFEYLALDKCARELSECLKLVRDGTGPVMLVTNFSPSDIAVGDAAPVYRQDGNPTIYMYRFAR